MNIKVLSLKNKKIKNSSNEEYYDLSAPSFEYDNDLGIKGLHYVLLEEEGRIDKISETYFGSTKYICAICKINNIFNPYSIKEGDLLIIPNLDDEQVVYSRPNQAEKQNISSLYKNKKYQNEIDENRLKRIKERSKKTKKSPEIPLPPNMLQEGENVKEYKDSRIKLGKNLNS